MKSRKYTCLHNSLLTNVSRYIIPSKISTKNENPFQAMFISLYKWKGAKRSLKDPPSALFMVSAGLLRIKLIESRSKIEQKGLIVL